MKNSSLNQADVFTTGFEIDGLATDDNGNWEIITMKAYGPDAHCTDGATDVNVTFSDGSSESGNLTNLTPGCDYIVTFEAVCDTDKTSESLVNRTFCTC